MSTHSTPTLPPKSDMACFVQVLTACFAAFAHGANDVANSIAPLAANIAIYNANALPKKSAVCMWEPLKGNVHTGQAVGRIGHRRAMGDMTRILIVWYAIDWRFLPHPSTLSP